MKVDGLDLSNIEELLVSMYLDESAGPLSHLYTDETTAAKRILEDFLKKRFGDYIEHRNQP